MHSDKQVLQKVYLTQELVFIEFIFIIMKHLLPNGLLYRVNLGYTNKSLGQSALEAEHVNMSQHVLQKTFK